MRKLLSFFLAGLSALFLCPQIQAAAGGQLIYDSYLPIPAVAAFSSTFSVRADGIDWASAQIVLTSVTAPAQEFTDGQASTTSFTVNSFAALSTATATGSVIISSNGPGPLTNACLSGGGPSGLPNFNVCNPGAWAIGNVSSNTACNIAAAINNFAVGLSTCSWSVNAGIIFTTASYGGAVWNSFDLASSTQAAMTVPNLISSSPVTGVGLGRLSGGTDNATLSINGVTLTANQAGPLGFYPLTSNSVTATNIANAISLNTLTIGATATTNGAGVVQATATVVGAASNSFATFTSTQGALALFPFVSSSPVTGQATGTMLGGANANYTINTSTIVLNSTGTYGTGLAVLYTTTTGNTSLLPLTYLTTYYEITSPALGSGAIELALTSTGAVANLPIVLTSSQTKTIQDNFTLTPLAISGTPSVTWVASNDNLHWLPYTATPFNISIPSISFANYISTGTVMNFDFGHFNYSYLGLSVVAPTAGAVNVGAHVVGNAP